MREAHYIKATRRLCNPNDRETTELWTTFAPIFRRQGTHPSHGEMNSRRFNLSSATCIPVVVATASSQTADSSAPSSSLAYGFPIGGRSNGESSRSSSFGSLFETIQSRPRLAGVKAELAGDPHHDFGSPVVKHSIHPPSSLAGENV